MRVQRHDLVPLGLPRAVDVPADGQLAEDRHVAAFVRLLQPPQRPAFMLQDRAQITRATALDVGFQHRMTQAQQPLP